MTRSNTDASNHSRQQRTVLLATDQKNSVLCEIESGRNNPMAYSAYGYQSAEHDVVSCLGFNGELREASHWYFLGNGYRVFNPRLMRFHSPDSWSPFGRGGLNAYMYCAGDPVNFSDPTGHMHKGVMSFFKKPSRKAITRTSSTSSVDQLIPSNSPPTSRRTGPFPSIPEQTALPNAGAPLDPSTGENIYGHLPAGRRNWTPPPTPTAPAEMMTFAEFSLQQSSAGRPSTLASVNAPTLGPPVNRSVKPTNPAKRNIPKHLHGRKKDDVTRPLPPAPLTSDHISQGFSIDSAGVERVDLQVYGQTVRSKK